MTANERGYCRRWCSGELRMQCHVNAAILRVAVGHRILQTYPAKRKQGCGGLHLHSLTADNKTLPADHCGRNQGPHAVQPWLRDKRRALILQAYAKGSRRDAGYDWLKLSRSEYE